MTDYALRKWFDARRRSGPALSNPPQIRTPTGALTPMSEWLAARRRVLIDWRDRADPDQCTRATLDQYYLAEDQYEDLVKQANQKTN